MTVQFTNDVLSGKLYQYYIWLVELRESTFILFFRGNAFKGYCLYNKSQNHSLQCKSWGKILPLWECKCLTLSTTAWTYITWRGQHVLHASGWWLFSWKRTKILWQMWCHGIWTMPWRFWRQSHLLCMWSKISCTLFRGIWRTLTMWMSSPYAIPVERVRKLSACVCIFKYSLICPLSI